MNNSSENDNNDERREYFRVDQDLIFEFKTVDSDTAENSDPHDAIDDGRASELVSELRKLDESMQVSLKNISEKNREIGSFLQKLNQKVDLIAKSTLFNQKTVTQESSRINLSEGGIAFSSKRALYKGNYVVIRLIFLPSFIPLILFGKVIRCESDNEEYQIAASFYKIRESDRRELARQLLRAQVRNREKQ